MSDTDATPMQPESLDPTSALQALLSKPPNELTRENLDAVVANLRAERKVFLVAETAGKLPRPKKPPKAKATPAELQNLLDDILKE